MSEGKDHSGSIEIKSRLQQLTEPLMLLDNMDAKVLFLPATNNDIVIVNPESTRPDNAVITFPPKKAQVSVVTAPLATAIPDNMDPDIVVLNPLNQGTEVVAQATWFGAVDLNDPNSTESQSEGHWIVDSETAEVYPLGDSQLKPFKPIRISGNRFVVAELSPTGKDKVLLTLHGNRDHQVEAYFDPDQGLVVTHNNFHEVIDNKSGFRWFGAGYEDFKGSNNIKRDLGISERHLGIVGAPGSTAETRRIIFYDTSPAKGTTLMKH